MKYLLFGEYKRGDIGAYTFVSAHDTQAAAMGAGMECPWLTSMSSWMHLVEFDGTSMEVTHDLNIPGTEYAEGETLEWRPV